MKADGGIPHSSPLTADLWCDGCRFFGIHGLHGQDADAAGLTCTCSRPELQRPPREVRYVAPLEMGKCYYREEE